MITVGIGLKMFENQISTLGQFQGIQLESDIAVITLNDNISHTYCSKIKWEHDNRMPIGVAQLIMPYSTEIASYWMKYPGAVVIHANLNSRPQSITQAMMENFPVSESLNWKKFQESKTENEDEDGQGTIKTQTLKDAQKETTKIVNDKTKKNSDIKKDKKTKQLHLKNDEYNYAYIGKVARFKQVGTTFIVYLEDLGWKFMQKVPKEFRDSYISGQSLDDAFQAICEFMGVEFAYSIEDLSEYNFGADGYSVEKDGQVIEDVSTVLSEWSNKKEDENNEEENMSDEEMADALKDGRPFENSGLDEYKKKKQSTSKKTDTSKKSNTSLNSQVTNTQNDNTTTSEENKEEDTEDKKQTSAEKIEEYQEEFDEKIKHLFIGNTLYDSNISDPILNYDWITIVPTPPQNTSTDTAGATTGTSATTGANNNNSTDTSKNGWINGQYYKNGKIYLYTSYINSLPPSQAEAKYIGGQNTYTQDTLDRLRSRAAGNTVWA